MTKNVTDLHVSMLWRWPTPLYSGFPSSIKEHLFLLSLSWKMGEGDGKTAVLIKAYQLTVSALQP